VRATSFSALGTTATIAVTDDEALDVARTRLRVHLELLDHTCSRFRPDSELQCANARSGRAVAISPLLAELIAVALAAAETSASRVDPTLARSLRAAGYDRTFSLVRARETWTVEQRRAPAEDWRGIELDATRLTLRTPPGIELDLGATAKAWASDHAAHAIARETGCGVLVSLGGDIAVAGGPPVGGWPVQIAEDHAAPAGSGRLDRIGRPRDVDHDRAALARRGRRRTPRARSVYRPARHRLLANRQRRRGELRRGKCRGDGGDRAVALGSRLARRSSAAREARQYERRRRSDRRLAGGHGGCMIAAAGNAKVFWYLTRGTGIVALLLLTASVVLGVLTTARWRSPRWPRFALSTVHRNLTLLTIAFVAVHVVTTVLDGYAPIRLVDALVPFVSQYRPVWLGLGALAFDLLLALVVTSLLRARLGYRLWRQIHWLAYASWPVALVHALGTGTDGRVGFMLIAGFGSLAVVALAVLARVALTPGRRTPVHAGAALAALIAPLAIVVWYESGPAKHGWARRAGTPATLLASGRRSPRRVAALKPVRTSFAARLVGRMTDSTNANGLVDVVITGKLDSGRVGAVRLDLRGEPLGGGVAMTASGVSYVPAGTRTVYEGSVSTLNGQQVIALVSAGSGQQLQLIFNLNIDAAAGTVSGTVSGAPATSE
jgi:ApbE family/Ferric reductase like transmembrane component